MTFRLPLSVEKVKWFDGQQVDEKDFKAEQNYNVQTNAAVINNFFGSGLLLENTARTVLFDSDIITADQVVLIGANNYDGYALAPNAQPTAPEGVQLEVELSGSSVFGRQTTKALIVGLDFEGNLQYEKFAFKINEKQVGRKHFTSILMLMFENFKGNNNCSRNNGGRITIKEALPMQASRSALMISQDVEPDIFFRDFKIFDITIWPNPTVALKQIIQNGIGPGYSVDSLNITQTGLNKRTLAIGDLTTVYGQKFLSSTNNIQKVTLLLGVEKNGAAPELNWYDWSGDLIVSIYPLQTSVTCITDIVPETAIDFPPDVTPLAQLSLNQSELQSAGYILNDVAQPIDFVFTHTKVGGNINTGINPGKYYAVTIRRSGIVATGDVFTHTGGNRTENAKFTFFNAVGWNDVADEDMWFQIWSDAIKVSDGMGVDAGNGMFVPKTLKDSVTGVVKDYSLENISLSNNGENIINYSIAQAIDESYSPVQHPITGEPKDSRDIVKASISNITSSQLSSLENSSDPVILGCSYDLNNKSNISFEEIQPFIGLTNGNVFSIVAPSANILGTNLIGAKLTPNKLDASIQYRIVNATLCVDGYGDVNGDGVIDDSDLSAAIALLGHGMVSPITQTAIVAGTISALEVLRADVDGDGIITVNDVSLINQYINHQINSFPIGETFNRINLYVENIVGRNDGYFDCGDINVRKEPLSTTRYNIAALTFPKRNYYGHPEPVEIQNDVVFITVPFVPVTYIIANESDFWDESLLKVSNIGRFLPCSFTYMANAPQHECTFKNKFGCEDRYIDPVCDGGRNDFFVPGNLVMGSGQILNGSGDFWPVDLEINTVNLEIPQVPYSASTIDIFRLFVAENLNGFTVAGYKAMKFSDCSFVQMDAMAKNQIKFAVAIKSIYPNLDGYVSDDGYGVIIDPMICTDMNESTGVLTFRAANLSADPILKLFRTKIEITVYAKKAGWKNSPVSIDYSKFDGLVGL